MSSAANPVNGAANATPAAGGQRAPARGSAPARQLRLSWALSGHALRLITLALTGLIIAVVTRRPEFAGVAAPAVLLLAARRPPRPDQVGVRVRPGGTRVTEDDEADLEVAVGGHDGYMADLVLHPRFAVTFGTDGGGGGKGGGGGGDESRLPFTVGRSGRRGLGVLEITLRDRWRLTEGRAEVDLPIVDCYPRPAAQRTRVVLSRLPSRLGEHPSRSPGEGLEFAGVREFVPGDRQRRINWAATTRRGRLQLNTFAAERTQNVVIIADVTSDVGEPGSTPLDLALRGAAGMARAYLEVRDRVGFVLYQRSVLWTAPGTGARHYYRIMDLMLAAGAATGRSGPATRAAGIARLPRAALPPGALVLVFTPLLDRRLVETIRDLRERGFPMLVIDVLNAEPSGPREGLGGLALRIWRMEQHAIRFSLRELGIPLVRWDGVQSLDEPLAPYTRRVLVTRR
jgi:uncharacterized protein (DUF58 family)